MSSEIPPLAVDSDSFSDPEMALTGLAQDAYGAQAREAALRLVSLLGLDESSKEQFMSGVITRVEAMGWDQRKDTAETIDELTTQLGRTACGDASPQTELLIGSTRPFEDSESNITEGELGVATGEAVALSRPQQSMLKHFLNADDIARLEVLDSEQRMEFGRKVGLAYIGLKARGHVVNPRLEWQPAEQFAAFMQGKTYGEVASLLGEQTSDIKRRFIRMITAVASTMDYEEIAALIPEPRAAPIERSGLVHGGVDNTRAGGLADIEGWERDVIELMPNYGPRLIDGLKAASRRDREIVRRSILLDETQTEIGEHVGVSQRTVSGVLQRLVKTPLAED